MKELVFGMRELVFDRRGLVFGMRCVTVSGDGEVRGVTGMRIAGLGMNWRRGCGRLVLLFDRTAQGGGMKL